MPNKKSAKKRMRQNEKRRLQNKSYKTGLKTQVKKLLKYMKEDDVEKTRTEFDKTMAMLDRVGRKGILHKNNTDRQKSKIHRKFNLYLANQSEKNKE